MNKKSDKSTATAGGKRSAPAGKKQKSSPRISIRLKFSLAIIALVSIIIITITLYFIYRESNLLKAQAFQLVERETIHLANTTR